MEHNEQHDNSSQKRPTHPRRPRLRLPFDNRRKDPIERIYDSRIGIGVIIVVMTLLVIGFVWAKISLDTDSTNDTIYIDMVDEEVQRTIEERERLEEELQQLQDDVDWRSVQNVVSNENAEELKDDRGTDMKSLKAEAEQLQNELESGSDEYSAGLSRVEEMKYQHNTSKDDKTKSQKKDGRVKGAVMVSFSLKNPLRHEDKLNIPAYRCERGGEVVVEITVNRAGRVIVARIKSGGDHQMQEVALDAARRSTFDINNSAPERQVGTITYIFIPQ